MKSISQTKWNPNLYNSKHSFVYNYGEELIALLNPQKHERILDLGCGSGQLTQKISLQAKEVIGIDKSTHMIADAKSRFENIDFHVKDASDFYFDEKFEAIFSNATLHWVTDYMSVIKCMYNNLNNGGRIVLEFGGKNNVETLISNLKETLKEYGYFEQSELVFWFFPSIGEYTTSLESAGFKVVFAQHFDRPTELSDEKSGIKDWLSMFAQDFFKGIPEKEVEKIKENVQKKAEPICLKNGKWFADYKRIRIIAVKE